MRLFRLFLILKISICLKISTLHVFSVDNHAGPGNSFNFENYFLVAWTKYNCERSVVCTELLYIL